MKQQHQGGYMNKLKMALVAVLLLGISALAMVGIGHVQALATNVPTGKVVDGSLYSAGNHVVVNGTINGDVFCAGQDIEVNGTVHGDVICAGRSVVIRGVVDGNVRLAGQEVHLEATVGRSATVAGQLVHISEKAKIGQDLTVGGNKSTVMGTVGRDAVIGGTNTTVGATVGRNVRFGGTQIALVRGTVINGTVTYDTNRDIIKESGVTIKGATVHTDSKQKRSGGGISKFMFIIAIAMTAFAMVLVLILPQQVHKVSGVAVAGLGKVVLTGVASIFAFPLAIGIIGSTVVGLPLAVLGVLIMITVILLSGPITAYYLGSMLFAKWKNPIQIMAVGALVLLFLYALPVIGPLCMLIGYVIGSGALLLSARRAFPKPVYKVD